jgi:transcriptional regulator with XRE-family HTH domain
VRNPINESERKQGLEIARRLRDFWSFHRGFDANMKSLALHTGVSRDTVYRWLQGKGIPRPEKTRLIEEWLAKRAADSGR